MEWSAARTAIPSTSPIWQRPGCIAAMATTQSRSSHSRSEPFSRIRRLLWRSGSLRLACRELQERNLQLRTASRFGCYPEVRMVHDASHPTCHAVKVFVKLGGPDSEIEADETFVGGKARNMHKCRSFVSSRRGQKCATQMRSARYWGKTAVMGMLDREPRKVRATVVPNVKRETLQNQHLREVEPGSKFIPMKLSYYKMLCERIHP